MKYITYALAYLWCTFAIYTLRFDSDSVSWLDVALRSLIYATAFFLPSFCLLCHGLKRRCQHQRASASNLRSTTPADAIGRAAACNEAPLLSAASQKTDSNSLPSFQPSQQYAFRSYPAAQHGSQQSQLLLPPEISLREWKRSSTKADDIPTTEDAPSSRTPDATAFPPCPAHGTAAGECPFAPHQGLGSSSLISSSELKQLKPLVQQTCSTDEACLHAPVSADTCLDLPAYLLLDESAESAGSVQGTDGMRMTPDLPCSTTIPPCSNISSCDRADAAHHLAPAAASDTTAVAAITAIQQEAVSCNAVHSASITALSVAASCDVQCKVPAMPCTAATCAGGPATPCQSLQTQLPAVDEPAAAPFTSKPPSPAAAAQHQEPQPEISLLLQAEDAEQSCFVLSLAAQTAVSALGDAASRDNHKLQESFQHQSQYYPYRCAQSPAATPTAAGQTDALRAAATSLSPSPADLTIITARRTKSEAPQQQQQQHSDEDHSSEVSSVASIEQPTTPVFISTSTRYMKTLSRTTSSLASGFSCSLSSNGSTAAAAAVTPPPLPSPAESPLARRLTNDRDELGYPTSPGLVELLQQREQRRSHGACADTDNQQQQLAPWAGLQLRSVVQRRWSGDLDHQNRVRGAICRSQSCLSGGSSSKGAKQHCCSSSVDGGDQKAQQRCDSYALMMTESASEDCSSSSGSSSEQLVCVGERADAVAAQERCSSSTPYQQLLALYEGVSG